MGRLTGRCAALCCVCLLVAGTRAAAQTGEDPDPRAPWFARDHVLDIAIELAQADWEDLRAQTRTLQDILGGDDCLAQPVEDIFTWFKAAVTVDGAAHAEVGVRKKGFFGSLSSEKPSLKLRFDKYVDGRLLGGAIDRMTLNNSLQDASMISTCLAYEVFAAAGLPAPRCNFATVTVNGADLGLYVHVEEIKPPFLAHHFASAAGNLYEGTLSDFDPGWRGTFEKKTNEAEDDWSDVDAVIAALQDPSPAGLEALDAIVDVDRFLSFWATEVMVGHWDGYAGNRNNYQFYREPDGRFVFIPWGVDAVFETTDVPFDDFVSPPSVNAHGVLAHRLYRDEAGRAAYAGRLRELLDAVWDEEELLRSAGELAAIVQAHAPLEAREEAAGDTVRVRRFILKRRGELLADLEPEPPDWPWPLVDAADVCWGEGSGVTTFEVAFKTTWGTKNSSNPFETGTITSLALDGTGQPPGTAGATAGLANAEEAAEVGLEDGAFLSVMRLEADFSIEGFTVWLPVELLSAGTELTIGEGGVGGVQWTMPPGAAAPEAYVPIVAGTLELAAAGTEPGAAISGGLSGAFGFGAPPADQGAAAAAGPATGPLVINEVAAQGDPLDWVELYNAADADLALADFVIADDLKDAGKRVPFPVDLVIPAGGYLRVELDKDGWPGFALGKDEEVGIWTAGGALAAAVDWDEGQADAGTSFARVPDAGGEFRTVSTPTPGAPNQGRGGNMTDTWTWEPIARHDVITEGPAWDGAGLRYTEIGANRLWRYTPADGRREVWRESTGGANGTIFDAAGRYYACEGIARRVVRYAAGQPTEVIADAHAGAPFNEPNDLAVDAAGRVWFSDPNYGERPLAQARESVYRCDPAGSGWTVTEVTTDTNRPNGVLLSADQSILYVAESPRRLDQRRQLRAYPIQADGSLGDYTLLHDFGAGRGVDGMCRADGGLIVATAGHQERGPGPAIYVFDAKGLPLSTHPTPADRPTNCTIGAPT